MRKTIILGLAAAFLFGVTAYGHHSFSTIYQLDDEMKLEGKLLRFLNRNPHSFIHIEVKDKSGKVQVWSVEGASASQFAQSGIQAATLKVGDPVIVTGNPARNPGEYRMRMVTLTRTTDGLTWGQRPGQVVD